MTPKELEDKVFEVEGVRIVIHAEKNEKLGNFSYVKRAPGATTIKEWLEQRILPITKNFEIVVLNGFGKAPNKQTIMSNLRDSYPQK